MRRRSFPGRIILIATLAILAMVQAASGQASGSANFTMHYADESQFLNMEAGQTLSFSADVTNTDTADSVYVYLDVVVGETSGASVMTTVMPGTTETVVATVPVETSVLAACNGGTIIVTLNGYENESDLAGTSTYTMPCSTGAAPPPTTGVSIPTATITSEVCGPNNDEFQLGDTPPGLLTPTVTDWENNLLVISYQPATGYHIDGTDSQTLQDTALPCLVEVIPIEPTQVAICGPNNDMLLLDSQPEGIAGSSSTEWIDGTSSVTYTATEGYIIPAGKETFAFTDANTSCDSGPEIAPTQTPIEENQESSAPAQQESQIIFSSGGGRGIESGPADTCHSVPVSSGNSIIANSGGGSSTPPGDDSISGGIEIEPIDFSNITIRGDGGEGEGGGGGIISISNTTIRLGETDLPICNYTFTGHGGGGGGGEGHTSGGGGGSIIASYNSQPITIYNLDTSPEPCTVLEGGGIITISNGSYTDPEIVPNYIGSIVTIYAPMASLETASAYATTTVGEFNSINLAGLPAGEYRVVIQPEGTEEVEIMVHVVRAQQVTSLPSTGNGATPQSHAIHVALLASVLILAGAGIAIRKAH